MHTTPAPAVPPPGMLERIRRAGGDGSCKTALLTRGVRQPEYAAKMLNDRRLTFPTLYILAPEIASLGLFPLLSPRCLQTLDLCAKVKRDATLSEAVAPLLPADDAGLPDTLLWVFRTGAPEDGKSDGYDAVLDAAASLLIRHYHDRRVLPEAAELIFRRDEKGRYTHDLVWSFFEARDPDCLRLVARRLSSPKPAEAALACRLLNLDPPAGGMRRASSMRAKSAAYRSWYRENAPYLYFTGESNNLTSKPARCRIDLGAKYLARPISPKDRSPVTPLHEDENRMLDGFRRLDGDAQKRLSAYSVSLRRRGTAPWRNFMRRPLEEQLRAAERPTGGGV